ncbi:cyclopropane-fatty-acyl-phospholipid synthase family protein [Halobacteriovorax sp. HLS]|uniref:SAM-dependent methyltransferase n=1 Tax=Halobacteriovorax sp. HLS TaxID=2234000 RepID=UPI000FD87C55|nr:cyclopropane-fatty-acyl-phospholipid synthase family protein [Halobacteriovorax sp. HLS]
MNSKVEINADSEHIPYWGKLFLRAISRIDYGVASVTLPNGSAMDFRGSKGDGTHAHIEIYDWKFCEFLFTKGDIGLGEAYIEGLWASRDISKLIEFGIENGHALERVIKGSIFKIFFYRIKHLLNRNTLEGSRKNIYAHYDLGNDFYSRWLDRSMTYSSALFRENEDLYTAQQNKYENIFNNLNVKRGDHILEIGCGWGGFAEFACSRGVKVTGVTISKAQYDYACERLVSYGEMANIELVDYRKLEGKFDHIVSIEMFEALGQEYWKTYFKKLDDLLSPNGTAIIQSITINNADFNSYRKGTDFIQQYIFPGGMLPSVEVFEKTASKRNLIVTDRLDFGESYARTLNEWEKEFTKLYPDIHSLGFDHSFYRTWEFYLKYCEGGFRAGKIGVSQFTLSKASL